MLSFAMDEELVVMMRADTIRFSAIAGFDCFMATLPVQIAERSAFNFFAEAIESDSIDCLQACWHSITPCCGLGKLYAESKHFRISLNCKISTILPLICNAFGTSNTHAQSEITAQHKNASNKLWYYFYNSFSLYE